MAWRSHGTSNPDLIAALTRNSLLRTPVARSAFLAIDRAHFAPSSPYQDRPQSIGYGATISAPHMHASAVEELLPYIIPTADREAPQVLDVGSGSGYLTAVLANLVGDKGRVVGIENIKELKELGEGNVGKSEEGRGWLEEGRVKFVVGDGRKGWGEGEEERWDAIHVGASAKKMHDELVRQLKRPGRMFIPVDDDEEGWSQHIWCVDKDGEGRVSTRKLFGVRYVPLTDAPS